ncbi:MAG TPA: FkbM family methyltransferase [Steroidobacteraceae bacterium]|nr:FkbM family methyltransferase [Steroidobacteraceae bacterium]
MPIRDSRSPRGKWEPDTFAIFDRFLDRQHCSIDVGAWIGPTLRYGCQLAKMAYGLEPDPIAFAELEQNIDLNRAMSDSIRLHQACIAPKTALVAVGSRGQGGDCTSSLLFGSRRTRWTVNAFSLDDFIRRNDIGACNVIMMEIERGAYQVLPTRAGYLQANRPTLKIIRWVGLYKHIDDHGGQELTARSLETVVRCLDSRMLRPATRRTVASPDCIRTVAGFSAPNVPGRNDSAVHCLPTHPVPNDSRDAL